MVGEPLVQVWRAFRRIHRVTTIFQSNTTTLLIFFIHSPQERSLECLVFHSLRYRNRQSAEKHMNGVTSSQQWGQDRESCEMANDVTFLIVFVLPQKHVISVNVQWAVLLK